MKISRQLPQFGLLAYNPTDIIPGETEEKRAGQLAACMAQMPGPVLNTRTGYLWLAAGKTMTIHEPAAADIFRTGPSPENAALRADFERRVTEQYYDAIMFGPQLTLELGDALAEHYAPVGYNFSPDGDGAAGYMLANTWVAKRVFAGRKPDASAGFCEQ